MCVLSASKIMAAKGTIAVHRQIFAEYKLFVLDKYDFGGG